MFLMMNSARLHVGLQGLGHLEMATQNALRHADCTSEEHAPALRVTKGSRAHVIYLDVSAALERAAISLSHWPVQSGG